MPAVCAVHSLCAPQGLMARYAAPRHSKAGSVRSVNVRFAATVLACPVVPVDRSRMKRTAALLALPVLAVTLSGCSGSNLEDDDPSGYEACQQFSAARASADGALRMESLMLAGQFAAEATTEAIRGAATPMFDDELQAALADAGVGSGFWLVDAEVMLEACEEAGVDIADDAMAR